jgi:hypothetical protein
MVDLSVSLRKRENHRCVLIPAEVEEDEQEAETQALY